MECSRQKMVANQHTIWDDSESEHEEYEKPARPASTDAHLERGCSDLYEDDEDSEAIPK